MKQNKIIIWLVILLTVFFNPVNAQNQFEKTYRSFQLRTESIFKTELKEDELMDGYLSKIESILVIPKYKFVCNADTSFYHFLDVSCLKLDTAFKFSVFEHNKKAIGYGEKDPEFGFQNYKLDINSKDFELFSKSFPLISLVERGKKLSNTLFFISFDNNYSWKRIPAIGFLNEDNEVRLLDTSSQVLPIPDYLCKQYGSIEKYMEVVKKTEERELARSKLLTDDTTQALLNCINFLRSNYSNTVELFEEDTVRVLNSFFLETNNLVNLHECQFDLLQKKIRDMNFKKNRPQVVSDFTLYNNDLWPIIKLILTKAQFDNYLTKKNMNDFLEIVAFDYLVGYVNKGKGPYITVEQTYSKIRALINGL